MIGSGLQDEILFLIIPFDILNCVSNLLDDMDLEETCNTGYEKE